jgi:hypothetical protein
MAKVKKLRPGKKGYKRPFKNLYYHDMTSADPAWTSQGNCKTEENAKRHAWVKLGMRECVRAAIVERESGVVLYTLKRNANGVTEHFGSAETRLRRVK